ncbi:acyl transferase/acyl hydrolase/lysophospholipase [Annulohypoxylon truncatum]|uniref:acyl transferase/acyl hydrolase/lysophospholipase n=1 Tax=Annulohypoxylon truncatum TaxID=327061 RepID=UPI0020085028|nr:acyl transferase/acyl hydrolase/lysophospholipase [Annulohypoxylon truncatum]KAI1214452.1 acyl transferase/acyl hydrolase/lysophospholipase [Annulohypoxylon truncatum]
MIDTSQCSTQAPNRENNQDERSPWLPIILSLDGGGVRGLSSLYFLKKIMEMVREEENRLEPDTTKHTQGLPLPCNYFDFMIGTSTGGLIAIMLGRLRMGVDDCIKQYLVISQKVFRRCLIPIIQEYSGEMLADAVCKVVKDTCQFYERKNCTGKHLFRQYDHMERNGNNGTGGQPRSNKINSTCKVAVTSVRNGGANSHSSAGSDISYLFRSYDSAPRYDPGEYNPKSLDQSKLLIHEASRATTAAPAYFPVLLMRGRRFMDGGVFANNPSEIALNEAMRMCNEPNYSAPSYDGRINHPIALVSVGTGGSKGYNRFSWSGLFRAMRQRLTDAEPTHESVRKICANSKKTEYFRFNVMGETRNANGLNIGLAECKRKKIESRHCWAKGEEVLNTQLEKDADEDVRGGYRPTKYHYTTFNKIRVETEAQFTKPYDQEGEQITNDKLKECAKLLVTYSRKRRENDLERWEAFRRHPHLNH